MKDVYVYMLKMAEDSGHLCSQKHKIRNNPARQS